MASKHPLTSLPQPADTFLHGPLCIHRETSTIFLPQKGWRNSSSHCLVYPSEVLYLELSSWEREPCKASAVLGSRVGRDGSSPWLLDPLLPLDTSREGRAGCFCSVTGRASDPAPKPGSGAGVAAMLVGLAGGAGVCRGELVAAAGEVGPCPAWRQNKKQGERSRGLLSSVCLFQIPLGANVCQEGS